MGSNDSTSLSRAQQRKIIGRAGGKLQPLEYNFLYSRINRNSMELASEERVTRVRHLENTSIIEHLG